MFLKCWLLLSENKEERFMADFKKQIEEDIRAYQEKYGDTMLNINKDEWAFNFWILDKFFYEDAQ